MISMQERSREARARRIAYKQGLRVEKSNERNPKIPHYGQFTIWDQRTDEPITVNGELQWYSLDEVEQVLMITEAQSA